MAPTMKRGLSVLCAILSLCSVFFYLPLLSDSFPGFFFKSAIDDEPQIVIVDVDATVLSGPSAIKEIGDLVSRIMTADPRWISVAIYLTQTGDVTNDCNLLKILSRTNITVADLAGNNSQSAVWGSNIEGCRVQIGTGYVDATFDDKGFMVGIPYLPESGKSPLFLKTGDGVLGKKKKISKLIGEIFPVNENISSIKFSHFSVADTRSNDFLATLKNKVVVIGSLSEEHKIKTQHGVLSYTEIQANYIFNAIRGSLHEVPAMIRLGFYLIFFAVTVWFVANKGVRSSVAILFIFSVANDFLYGLVNFEIYPFVLILTWLSALLAGISPSLISNKLLR